MTKLRVAMLLGTTHLNRMFEPEYLNRLQNEVSLLVHSGEKAPTLNQAKALLKGAQACITSWGSPPFSPELLDVAPDLRLIVHSAGSIKPIVTDEVYSRNITITSGAGAIGVGVAETALGLIIMSMKNVFAISRSTQEEGWNSNRAVRQQVKEMIDTTVGVVGAGHVGRHLVKLLHGFSIRVLLFDPTLQPEQALALGTELVSLEQLMRESDVVSLHAPAVPATHHMINAERLRLLKDGATLINTARGSLIDEDALVAELSTGRISACLDVTDPEPPAAGSPLFSLPNVVLTPHIAGAVTTGLNRLGRYAVEEIERLVDRKPALNAVTKDQLTYLA